MLKPDLKEQPSHRLRVDQAVLCLFRRLRKQISSGLVLGLSAVIPRRLCVCSGNRVISHTEQRLQDLNAESHVFGDWLAMHTEMRRLPGNKDVLPYTPITNVIVVVAEVQSQQGCIISIFRSAWGSI